MIGRKHPGKHHFFRPQLRTGQRLINVCRVAGEGGGGSHLFPSSELNGLLGRLFQTFSSCVKDISVELTESGQLVHSILFKPEYNQPPSVLDDLALPPQLGQGKRLFIPILEQGRLVLAADPGSIADPPIEVLFSRLEAPDRMIGFGLPIDCTL